MVAVSKNDTALEPASLESIYVTSKSEPLLLGTVKVATKIPESAEVSINVIGLVAIFEKSATPEDELSVTDTVNVFELFWYVSRIELS